MHRKILKAYPFKGGLYLLISEWWHLRNFLFSLYLLSLIHEYFSKLTNKMEILFFMSK